GEVRSAGPWEIRLFLFLFFRFFLFLLSSLSIWHSQTSRLVCRVAAHLDQIVAPFVLDGIFVVTHRARALRAVYAELALGIFGAAFEEFCELIKLGSSIVAHAGIATQQ